MAHSRTSELLPAVGERFVHEEDRAAGSAEQAVFHRKWVYDEVPSASHGYLSAPGGKHDLVVGLAFEEEKYVCGGVRVQPD
jgi:hypothetical protein